ncbi:hypothetical protein L1049_026931 [Liquidambar formosana]|uniref:Endoglucanase n=1 Tax=Liquidambar formosana TaxID=63359 RepID=A0AAP0NFU2_LIQFO
MPGSRFSLSSPTHSSCDIEMPQVRFVHSIPEAGRLLPSSSRWNSIELNFNMFPQSSTAFDSLPSRFSKSVDFKLVITDKKCFHRFLYITVSVVFIFLTLILLLQFMPRKHKHHGSSKNLTLALNQALVFFDAQKSGIYPKNSSVTFRGDSGKQDGDWEDTHADLVGGFYDSGNNIKFSFPTAYTITLLSWTVIEYPQKYADIGELDHVKDIIKWGSDYLLKLFIPPNTTSDPTIFTKNESTYNDINCWQRPEDMSYPRPVSKCSSTASDLAGEIVAALSAASLVFKEDNYYSGALVKRAEMLFEIATAEDTVKQGTYTTVDANCGGEATLYYNSTGYKDELVWGGTWLFFATGNTSHLRYATDRFKLAREEEAVSDQGIFYWNNKLTASAVLLTRLRFFHDLGYPYEDALGPSSDMTESLMCSYLFDRNLFKETPGKLILLRPEYGAPLQFAATASFLSKLYSDYLNLLRRTGGSCGGDAFSLEMLRTFSMSQASNKYKNFNYYVNYILGDNPMKMSYMVGFGDQYPTQVHHRSASIPWDYLPYSCPEGDRWKYSKQPNPNILLGAMVAGPDQVDNFLDERDQPLYTEPTIASNAGLVAALIALHDPPRNASDDGKDITSGIDQMGIFGNIRLLPPAS